MPFKSILANIWKTTPDRGKYFEQKLNCFEGDIIWKSIVFFVFYTTHTKVTLLSNRRILFLIRYLRNDYANSLTISKSTEFRRYLTINLSVAGQIPTETEYIRALFILIMIHFDYVAKFLWHLNYKRYLSSSVAKWNIRFSLGLWHQRRRVMHPIIQTFLCTDIHNFRSRKLPRANSALFATFCDVGYI